MNALLRKLYGYDTHSNYSRYNRHLKGLIEVMPSIRYDGDLIMIRESSLDAISRLVEQYGAEYTAWRVISNEKEREQLQLQAA